MLTTAYLRIFFESLLYVTIAVFPCAVLSAKPILSIDDSAEFIDDGEVEQLTNYTEGSNTEFVIKKNDDLYSVVDALHGGRPNTTYIVNNSFDLEGKSLTVPNNCTLTFKRGGCLKNGIIKGSNTTIFSNRTCFDNIVLDGSFSNKKGHLSWFKKTEDITSQFLSILNKFRIITIDYGGIISDIPPRLDFTTVIDGCGSTIILRTPSFIWCGTAGKNSSSDIEICNLAIDYKGRGFDKKNVQTFSIVTHGNVTLSGLSIKNYTNKGGEISSFEGIAIYPFEDSRAIIKNCSFENLIVGGDGIVGNQFGSCDAITVTHYMMKKVDQHSCGSVLIEDCQFNLIQNIDQLGNYIMDDAGGIGIGMQGDDAYGVHINKCSFKDVSKRIIKIQGNGIKVSNIRMTFNTKKIPIETAFYCIGSDGYDINVTGVKGKYPAPFFKNSQGNRCQLKGINVEATSLIHIGIDTDYDYYLKDCTIKNAKFGIYLSAYNQVSQDYIFRSSPNQGIVVDNCRFIDCQVFYYAANGVLNRQKPIAEINNCKVNCNRLLDGGAYRLAFNQSVIIIKNKDYPESIVSPNVNLSLKNTTLNLLSNTYRGDKQTYFLSVSHLDSNNSHFKAKSKNPIDVVVNIARNPVYTSLNDEVVIDNSTFKVPCTYDLAFEKGIEQPDVIITKTSFKNKIRFGNMIRSISFNDVSWKEIAEFEYDSSLAVGKNFVIKAENIPIEKLPKETLYYMNK